MSGKMHQNRIVIVGRNYDDAHAYANGPRFKDTLESPTIITSASHRITILGATGGMHIGAFYVTPTAPEGEFWDVVEEVIARARKRNPAMKLIEEPRKVLA
jgi:hypothetical protein